MREMFMIPSGIETFVFYLILLCSSRYYFYAADVERCNTEASIIKLMATFSLFRIFH